MRRDRAPVRAIALLATHNERRFVGPCIRHLREHGLDTYLIDNHSTDETLDIAERYYGKGLIGMETLPGGTGNTLSLRTQLRRKEEVSRELEADWFMHVDADELRLPPRGKATLAEALASVDRDGFNAVNFLELAFIPTLESPEHDHPDYQRTLQTYYPLLPAFPHRLNAWKAHKNVDLTSGAGHRVQFPGLRMYPESFHMKHYLFLGRQHAIEKFVNRGYDREEVRAGWFGWRPGFTLDQLRLPSAKLLRTTRSDDDLDPSNPSKYHYFTDRWTSPVSQS